MMQPTPLQLALAVMSAAQTNPQMRASRRFIEIMRTGGPRIYDRRQPLGTADQDWERLYASPHVLRWDASRSPPPEAG